MKKQQRKDQIEKNIQKMEFQWNYKNYDDQQATTSNHQNINYSNMTKKAYYNPKNQESNLNQFQYDINLNQIVLQKMPGVMVDQDINIVKSNIQELESMFQRRRKIQKQKQKNMKYAAQIPIIKKQQSELLIKVIKQITIILNLWQNVMKQESLQATLLRQKLKQHRKKLSEKKNRKKAKKNQSQKFQNQAISNKKKKIKKTKLIKKDSQSQFDSQTPEKEYLNSELLNINDMIQEVNNILSLVTI